MNVQGFLSDNWPLLLVLLWFGYKWWNSRRVKALLPALKQQGALLGAPEAGQRGPPGLRADLGQVRG